MRIRGARRRIGRAVGDTGLTIGAARGLTHGSSGPSNTDLDARAALIVEGAHSSDGGSTDGLLDRVPGWLLLLVAGVIVILVLFFTSWQ